MVKIITAILRERQFKNFDPYQKIDQAEKQN